MSSDRVSIRHPLILLLLGIGIPVFLTTSAAVAPSKPVQVDEYEISARAGSRTANPDAAWHASNRAQGFTASFAEEGIRVVPLGTSAPSWQWGLSLASYGYAGKEGPAGPAAVTANRNRVEYRRGDLLEWYVNETHGLKHGLTLERPPVADGSAAAHEGNTSTLHLDFEITGALLPVKTGDGNAVEFILPGERFAALQYGGLKVTDAKGDGVPARLEVIGDGVTGAERAPSARNAAPKSRLRIVLDVTGAVFPLEVDPLLTTASWNSTEGDDTRSVAWGDWDGDGDLDLAVGNFGQNLVYENTGAGLDPNAVWASTEGDSTWSVAWGDWDGDGDLDLAAGNSNQPNRVYVNSGAGLDPNAVWSSFETDDTRSVAWGDWDGDGYLDLAAGNYAQANRVYANSGGSLSLAWSSFETDNTISVAWGDWGGVTALDVG
jgi:hypothetical protein